MSGELDSLFRGTQQMSVGERAALEGVLALAEPELAIEIGTADGGSLRRIAARAREVHSFDLVAPPAELRALDNVDFHTGSSHELMPHVLKRLADEGRNVDFVLVDGDHSAAGVRRDLEHLLESPAIGSTVIVIHDTANERVRSGIEAAAVERYGKVTYTDFDVVAGAMYRVPPLEHQLWGGLGIVVVDAANPRAAGATALDRRRYPTGRLLRESKALRAGGLRLRLRGLRTRLGAAARGGR